MTRTGFTRAGNPVDAHGYDRADQLSSITTTSAGRTIAGFAYQRDPNGQVTKDSPTGLGGPSHSYGYNQLNQLTLDNRARYSYDKADDPTQLANSQPLAYDAANQLTSGPGGTYSYDQFGERTKQTARNGAVMTSYGYDQAGRLTAAAGGIRRFSATYSYDGTGLRATRTARGTTSRYTWDQTGDLPTLLSDGPTSYIYGPDRLPIEQIGSSNATVYYHHDQLGSTRLLTDANGRIAAKINYDAYGKPKAIKLTASTPFLYAGQYTDPDTGLQYLRARYYDPAIAEFVSRDPLDAFTRAPYSYANDDPTNGTDPTGLSACLFGYCLGFHPVNPVKAVANFGAGFANAVTSTVTGGAVTVPAPFCGAGLDMSYQVGAITAGSEAAVAGGVAGEGGLAAAGAGPVLSPIYGGMASGVADTVVTHGGHVSVPQVVASGLWGGGLSGMGGNIAGSLVNRPSRTAVSGAGGLATSWALGTVLP
jgi:RHS repeat-associated protein